MANVKWSDNTVFVPQTSPLLTDDLMGLTTADVNAKYPLSVLSAFIKNANNLSSEATHNTSVTLTGAEIVGGIIRSTPATAGVTLTMPTAAAIYAAMTQTPVVGNYVDCKFENFSAIPLILSVTDSNLLTAGVVSSIVGPQQSNIYRFTVTSTSPVQLVIDGGQFAPNNNPIMVFVNGTSGVDIVGNGSYQHPYATISFAQSRITDATPSKVYTIMASGNITDTGQIYLSPNINVFAISPDVALNNSLDIIEDPAWATAVPGSSYSYWQNMAIYGNVAIDFSTFGSSIFPFFQFIQTYFAGSTIVINGNPSGSGFPDTSVYFYQCYASAALQIDNCYVYAADNQWISAAYFGSGAATSCVEYYSVGDIFDSGLNFYDSNTASCSPVIQSNGTVYSTTGVLINSGVGAVSTISANIVGTLSNTPFSLDVDDSAGGAINATIVGSGKISSVTVTDVSGSGTQVTLTLDGPPATLSVPAGTPTITYNYVASAATMDTDQGFAVEPNGPLQFSWTGDGSLSGDAYTLLAGRGAHTTNGTDNIMLGKSATTQWVGGFMFSDSTNSSGGAYFPQGNNQSIFNAAGGFGIGNNSNTGTLGPQAGFDYDGFNGNDGNFLFAGYGAVISANMLPSKINPYVSTNTFAIQYTGSTGTAFTIAFPSGGGTVPTLSANQTWTGYNTFNQPIISNQVGLFATSFVLYSGSATLLSTDMIGGTIIANSVGAASFQLPTFTNFDAAMATFFNQAIPVNSLIFFTIENINSGPITLTPNTGFTILTENGTPVAAAFKSASYRAIKASSSSYTIYGS